MPLKANLPKKSTTAYGLRPSISDWMEQHALKNINSYLNINIYSYLETSGGQSSNLYLNVVQFFNITGN